MIRVTLASTDLATARWITVRPDPEAVGVPTSVITDRKPSIHLVDPGQQCYDLPRVNLHPLIRIPHHNARERMGAGMRGPHKNHTKFTTVF